MEEIAMNEYNKPRMIGDYTKLVCFLNDNGIPYVIKSSRLFIIGSLPSGIFTVINGYHYEIVHNDNKFLMEIDIKQFVSKKPEYRDFKKVFEYLKLETV